MGIEPTSAISAFYTAGCGKHQVTAARRLDRSAFGGRWRITKDQPRHFSPASQALKHIALINLHIDHYPARGSSVVQSMVSPKENLTPLFFRLCSDHLSVEAIPRRRLSIDILGMKDKSVREHELIMWTPHFVVLKNSNGQEITLRRDGRMVIRKANDEQAARLAATNVMRIALKEFGK
jgi:hypothetical protein